MKAGILLSGSGVMDGSEIHEAVLTLLHLDNKDLDIICMAPNQNQARVVNHSSNEIIKTDIRNMLTESARIARGNIKDISAISTWVSLKDWQNWYESEERIKIQSEIDAIPGVVTSYQIYEDIKTE